MIPVKYSEEQDPGPIPNGECTKFPTDDNIEENLQKSLDTNCPDIRLSTLIINVGEFTIKQRNTREEKRK